MINLNLYKRRTFIVLVTICLTAWLFPGQSKAQQAVNSATGVTLFPVGSVVRSHTIIRNLSVPGGGREIDVVALPVSLNYGASTNLTLAANIPWFRKELNAQTPNGSLNESTRGIGDISLLAKYRFFRADGYQKTLQLAALGGVQLPTGATNAKLPDGDFLPMPLQLGSGSTDPVAALSGTGIWDWRVAHVSLFYKRNTTGARDYKFGDLLNYDLATNFRVWTTPYPGPELYLGAELNGELRGKDQQNGTTFDNSGGNRIFVSPTAVFFLFRNLTFENSVQIPVYQNLNGIQPEDGIRFVVGLRFQYGLFF